LFYIDDNKETIKTRSAVELSTNIYRGLVSKTTFDNTLFIDQYTSIKIHNDIWARFDSSLDTETVINQNGKSRDLKLRNISVTLYSFHHEKEYIMQFLEYCDKYYKDAIDRDEQKKRRCYVLKEEGTENDDTPLFEPLEFKSYKTFDNVFFEKKEELLKRLEYFRDNCTTNKGIYERVGIPHTLGLLFHGEPGTGKTSTIKAIANYLNRNIIIIPLNKVTRIDTLKNVIYSDHVGYHKIPFNRRIYVFEEIDCNGWDHILQQRSPDSSIYNENNEMKNVVKEIADALSTNIQKETPQKSPKKEGEKITLGGVLEMFDGILEVDNRIIIMTSNYPEKLDKALLRPGRIDMKVEFKRLRVCDMCAIYSLWFGQDIPTKYHEKLQDHKYTQAEFGELCFKYMDSPDDLLEYLVSDSVQ
jgi:hypothetical protein